MDLEEACDFASRAWRPYLRVERLNRGGFRAFVRHARGEGVSATYFDTESHIDVTVGELESFYTLHLNLTGAAGHLAGREAVVCRPGHAVVHSPHEAVRYRKDGASRSLVLRIERDVVERELAALLDAGMPRPLRFAPALRLEGPGAGIAVVATQLTRALDAAPSPSTAPLAVTQLERQLATALLEAHAHELSAALAASAPAAGMRVLRRAEDFIHAALERALSIGDIARAAGVSARTLFREFQRRHGCAPMEYVRRSRLSQARSRLESGAVSVTDAAFEAGFVHLGRFAGFYRQAFGETPSQTLRRAQREAWSGDAAAGRRQALSARPAAR